MQKERPLAIVTGASSGIGLELAILAAQGGHDLVIGADSSRIFAVGDELSTLGVKVAAVETDLATIQGNDELIAAADGRPIALLCANAGHGLGHAFLDQSFDAIRHVIDTNVTGTLYLLHRVGRSMARQRDGRILVTGSIAGFIPGPYQAVYNGTMALLDSFAIALRAELKGTGVTVTNLMPGPTETDFFRRADLLDTRVGAAVKQPADEVARIGYEAMMRGEAQVVAGWKNKLHTFMAGVVPSTLLAEQHRMQAAPRNGRS